MSLMETYAAIYIPLFIIGNALPFMFGVLGIWITRFILYLCTAFYVALGVIAAKHLWLTGFTHNIVGWMSLGFVAVLILLPLTDISARLSSTKTPDKLFIFSTFFVQMAMLIMLGVYYL